MKNWHNRCVRWCNFDNDHNVGNNNLDNNHYNNFGNNLDKDLDNTVDNADMEFLKNFTLPDFQA